MNKMSCAAATIVLGFAVAGCTTAAPDPAAPPAGTDPVPTVPATTPDVDPTATPDVIDVAAHNEAATLAVQTAEAQVGGRVVALEWDEAALADEAHWELDVLVGDQLHEVQVAADGSSVTRTDDDPDTVDTDDAAAYEAATVTITDAIATALEQRADGRLVGVEFDEDDVQWEVSIDGEGLTGDDIVIDATSGTVVP